LHRYPTALPACRTASSEIEGEERVSRGKIEGLKERKGAAAGEVLKEMESREKDDGKE